MARPGARTKRRLIRSAAAGAVLAVVIVAPGSGAVQQPPRLAGGGYAITFVDARTGWVAGRAGIIATRDAGRTGEIQYGAPIIGLDAVDRRHAWAVSRGRIVRTTDGRRWSVGARRKIWFARIDFVDRRRGYALDRHGALLATTSGGRRWRLVRAPASLDALCFATAERGWVAHGGSVWRTGDGGATWGRTRLLRRVQVSLRSEVGCRDRSVWVLFHLGGVAGSEGYRVFRSLDSGTRWRQVLANLPSRKLAYPKISNSSGPFSVVDAHTAVFVGSCGPCGYGTTRFIRTTDGGRTWTPRRTFSGYYPDAISFVDANHGWLVVDRVKPPRRSGLVWRTTDGGRTWRLMRLRMLLRG